MQVSLWSGCVGLLALAGLSVFADRRRSRRANPDKVGWVPWPLVLILSLMGAAVFAAIALKAH